MGWGSVTTPASGRLWLCHSLVTCSTVYKGAWCLAKGKQELLGETFNSFESRYYVPFFASDAALFSLLVLLIMLLIAW